MGTSLSTTTKIAIAIGELGQGGSEQQLYMFLAHCDRERWFPMVYVSGGLGPWKDPIRDLGIPIIVLNGHPIRKMWRFRQLCKANGVRRFFSWSPYTNGYGLALLEFAILRVGSFRNVYPLRGLDRLGLLRSWTSLAAVDTIVCNSQEAASSVQSRVGNRKRVVYVPNAVQPPENLRFWRRSWRQRLEIAENEVLILGVGRLMPQKNFGRFIETVALANQRLPIRAIVAGRDEGYLEGLKRQANASGLAPGVIEFIGAVPRARELMCAADVFLLSSDYEGMPSVVQEAMAAGVPCVCTRVNGVRALIENGENGFMTDHRAEALAEKVLLLVSDNKLRRVMGERAAERMKQSFDPRMVTARLWELCEQ